MWANFVALIKTQQFITFIIGLIVVVGAKVGLNITSADQTELVAIFGAILGVQGLQAHGENAANKNLQAAQLQHQAAMLAHQTMMAQVANSNKPAETKVA